jgi:hypothetical protein
VRPPDGPVIVYIVLGLVGIVTVMPFASKSDALERSARLLKK